MRDIDHDIPCLLHAVMDRTHNCNCSGTNYCLMYLDEETSDVDYDPVNDLLTSQVACTSAA